MKRRSADLSSKLRRSVKRNKIAEGFSGSNNRTDEPSSKTKSSRKWEMWTEVDTKWFFEALCEYGKDFQNIQSYMAQRSEKKGIPQELIKNREQVRHYYYRTWHKIANSLEISDAVDKAIQEIYGLINYGEIWKKFGSKIDAKIGQHLNELVTYGHTCCKVKGKAFRLRTPSCKALKRINNISIFEKSSNLQTLPEDIYVELHPASNIAWLRVYSLSQNPRVRTKLSLQKRLSSLLEYLEKKWSVTRFRECESKLFCGKDLSDAGESKVLRIRPLNSANLVSVSIGRTASQASYQDLCLSAYMERILKNTDVRESKKKARNVKHKERIAEEQKVIKSNGSNGKTDDVQKDQECEKLDNGNILKTIEIENEQTIDEAERSLSLLKMLASMNEDKHENLVEAQDTDEEDEMKDDEESDEIDRLPLPNEEMALSTPPSNTTLAQWLSAKEEEPVVNGIENAAQKEVQTSENLQQEAAPTNSDLTNKSQINLDQARKGWTSSDCGMLTIGELYLLLKRPNKILLEYFWEPVETNGQICENVAKNLDNNKSSPNCASSTLIENKKSERIDDNQTQVLSKLLMAANLALINLKNPDVSNMSQPTNNKRKRVRPSTNNHTNGSGLSQLLSNVISNTIFNENSRIDSIS